MPATEVHESLKEAQAQGFNDTFSFRSGPKLVPRPKETPDDVDSIDNRVGFEPGEHDFLGDNLTLQLGNAKTVKAGEYYFDLPSGLSLTYGSIIGLAGDFYGTYEPISDGATLPEQMDRFVNAYNTLAAKSEWQPADGKKLIGLLEDEKDKVNAAFKDRDKPGGIDPSVVYAGLQDLNNTFIKETAKRPDGVAGYLGLAVMNWDHFGVWARKAYNAGHAHAMLVAAQGKGDVAALKRAYTMNAFADHYLTDSFSAGHMRTPRRQLHRFSSTLPIPSDMDYCSKYMHDEDSAIGLRVVNPRGETWRAYGDKRLLDRENDQNRAMCVSALRKSIQEIFHAWQTGSSISPDYFRAWDWAPVLDKVQSLKEPQDLAPLFTYEDSPKRRNNLANRRKYEFTSWFTYPTTVVQIKASGLWNYPIQLVGSLLGDAKPAEQVKVEETPLPATATV
ncbi:hypothetical protein B0T11DRAFT_310692 [Plectosphaerella cucumerina]|uniref:Phospholipase n=1 Tax=Plectosphaerella cucumerina TaxID=40658 RepID=A0A8K0X2J5_9PEZI|nr:hypothetical protein B0T11DRAFT_310692 [Plectosphaerella cucumerina]